jgi:predicted RNA-binding Zn ribbon-like protein
MSERDDRTPAGDGPAAGEDAPLTPLPLRWIEEFVNTRSVEFGTDEIATAEALGGWLAERRLAPAGRPVTAAEHDRALRVREGLRALIALNNAGEPGTPQDGIEPGALADLATLARELPLVLDVESRPPRMAPRDPGSADAALALMLGAVAQAVADGTWARFKACREPGCRWIYYDHSRNRSRTWCSMASCGNRAKARAFRRRSG